MLKSRSTPWLLVAGLCSACASPVAPPSENKAAPQAPAAKAAPAAPAFLSRAKHPSDNIWVAGQPSLQDLQAVKAAGVSVVVNMRAQGEPTGFSDEKATVEGLGLSYTFIPVAGAAGITDDNADKLKAVLQAHPDDKILLHCASGNRVGALMALIAFKDGKSVDEAMAVGAEAGMTALTPAVQSILQARAAAAKP